MLRLTLLSHFAYVGNAIPQTLLIRLFVDPLPIMRGFSIDSLAMLF